MIPLAARMEQFSGSFTRPEWSIHKANSNLYLHTSPLYLVGTCQRCPFESQLLLTKGIEETHFLVNRLLIRRTQSPEL